MKKIVALSCGTKNGMSETLLKEAAMGAEELGVQTEIIRAMGLKVLPCIGCNKCMQDPEKRYILNDDVDFILEQVLLRDVGVMVGVPCYHVRTNGLFACISERMNHVLMRDFQMWRKRRAGASSGSAFPAMTDGPA